MSDDTTYECQYCEKILSSKSNLHIHQRTAKYCLKIQTEGADLSQIKKIQCEYCNKLFSYKSSYTRHKTICEPKNKHCQEQKQTIHEKDAEIYELKQTIVEKTEELTQRGRKMGKLTNENIELKRKNKELEAENKKLEGVEQDYSKKYETLERKLNLVIEKHEKTIVNLEKKLAFEQGRVAGYENKAMFRGNNTTNVNNISATNVTNKKLAKICIENIDPFTIDLVQKNIDKFTADRYIMGAQGVAGFIEDITKFVVENGIVNRNYVCTDKPRASFYKLLESKDWQTDDGISCINSVLDTLEPVTMQLDREISKSVATQQSEKYKGIPVNDLGKGFTKEPENERHKFVCDVRNHVKEKIAI